MRNLGRTWAIIALVASAVVIPAASASATHTDPCPGHHVQVYNESSNTEVAHFVCSTGGGTGPTGPKGDDGKNGVDGKDGAKGDTGPAGPKGDTGAPGTDGVDGLPGTNGVDGKNGADGAPGEVGPIGPIGAPGAIGLPGLNGKDGNGIPGTDGLTGTDGKDGKDGVTKTVYIIQKADGTTETVSGLPHTGADDRTQVLLFLGAALLLGGSIIVYTAKRSK